MPTDIQFDSTPQFVVKDHVPFIQILSKTHDLTSGDIQEIKDEFVRLVRRPIFHDTLLARVGGVQFLVSPTIKTLQKRTKKNLYVAFMIENHVIRPIGVFDANRAQHEIKDILLNQLDRRYFSRLKAAFKELKAALLNQ